MMMTRLAPVTPCEIVAGRRSITADTDLRLCRFLGLSNGYWLRAQAAYDTEVAQESPAADIDRIKAVVGEQRRNADPSPVYPSGTYERRDAR